MNSESTNIDAINTSTHTNADYTDSNNTNNMNSNPDNTQNKTDSFNHAADNNRDNLRQGVSQPAETPNANSDSTPRDSESRDTGNRDSTTDGDNQERPKKGVAGIIESNFGADKTTTSTFEKSQGEKYGEGFDETGAQLKGRFSVDESAEASGSGNAAGGGDYAMGGKQGSKAGKDTNVPSEHGSHNGSQKEGFGHKIVDKAEGKFLFDA